MRSARPRTAAVLWRTLAAAGAALAGATASAQAVGELTVTGRMGPAKEAKSLSYPVSYRDLDLRTKAGQAELGRRIEITARYLCDQLGERDWRSPTGTQCEHDAERNAWPQAEAARSQALASAGPWTPGPTWTPPGSR